jgi:hypothetical protein
MPNRAHVAGAYTGLAVGLLFLFPTGLLWLTGTVEREAARLAPLRAWTAGAMRRQLGEADQVQRQPDGSVCRQWLNQGRRWFLVRCTPDE